jgi:prevent-host-death family protein
MKSFSFSDLNRHAGEVLDAALAAPVTLTKRGRPKLVVLPMESWKVLRHGRAFAVDNAPDEVLAVLAQGLAEEFPRKSGR